MTVDVDGAASNFLPHQLRESGFVGDHAHLSMDALSVELPRSLFRANGVPDVAVCNPPFLIPQWQAGFSNILEEVGLSCCLPAIANTDAALLFLAQNLRLLKPGGILGIIVPDSIASAEKYRKLRRELISRYCVIRSMRLARGSFGRTDALAHVLILRNAPPTSGRVVLSTLDDTGVERGSLDIDGEMAARRLDYQFHMAECLDNKDIVRLADVCLDLRRGSLNSAQAKSDQNFVLHTTDLDSGSYGKWLDFSSGRFVNPASGSGRVVCAEPGDIVVARVGRTAYEKVVGISAGRVVLTDCLYRLRVKPSIRKRVLQALSAAEGRDWLQLHAYGVAARQLTRSDLLNLPLSNI